MKYWIILLQPRQVFWKSISKVGPNTWVYGQITLVYWLRKKLEFLYSWVSDVSMAKLSWVFALCIHCQYSCTEEIGSQKYSFQCTCILAFCHVHVGKMLFRSLRPQSLANKETTDELTGKAIQFLCFIKTEPIENCS